MPSAPDPATVEAAFDLVADDTRVAILQALWDPNSGTRRTPVSFSTLYERTDVDDSGLFNYHLGQLVPQFVRKEEEGYTLTHAGARLVGDAASGAYTDAANTTLPSMPVTDCAVCGGEQVAQYGAGRLKINCPDCDASPDVMAVPPVVVDTDDPEDALTRAARFSSVTVERINRGFCELCDGPVESTVVASDPARESVIDGVIEVVHECGACGHVRRNGAVSALIGHPAVVSLLHEAGVDYRDAPVWEQAWIRNATTTVVSDDPFRVAVTTEIGDGEFRFELDANCSVCGYEHVNE